MTSDNQAGSFFRKTSLARFVLPIALIVVIVGAVILSGQPRKWIESTGRVTSVSQVKVGEGENIIVNFTYEVDGKDYEYTFMLDKKVDYSPGDTIRFYYDENNPERVVESKLGQLIAVILVIAGCVAVIVSVVSVVINFRKSRKAIEADFQDPQGPGPDDPQTPEEPDPQDKNNTPGE